MPRYQAIVEYLGTPYSGWQRQNNQPTVQEAIEKALFKFCGTNITIMGSSRTDAGVHAFGQVAHFDLPKEYSTFDIFNALNFYLRDTYIAILHIEKVADTFHSRFAAIQRHYIYKIINRSAPLAIETNKALFVRKSLNIDLMQQSAAILIGQHDFSSFRSSECVSKSPVKTLSKLDILQDGHNIDIHVSANAFLHHMVRNIVGTLLMIEQKKLPPESMQIILQAKSRANAGPTAPAHGLYFLKVDY